MKFVEHRQVMILGGGPAGFTAALYAARADLKPLLVTGMTLYGQASQTHLIENYPGFPPGIGGSDLGQLFDEQARRFGADVVFDTVQCVRLGQHPFEVCLSDTKYSADSLIISMGADARKLNLPGRKSSPAGEYLIARPAMAGFIKKKTSMSSAVATVPWKKPCF